MVMDKMLHGCLVISSLPFPIDAILFLIFVSIFAGMFLKELLIHTAFTLKDYSDVNTILLVVATTVVVAELVLCCISGLLAFTFPLFSSIEGLLFPSINLFSSCIGSLSSIWPPSFRASLFTYLPYLMCFLNSLDCSSVITIGPDS